MATLTTGQSEASVFIRNLAEKRGKFLEGLDANEGEINLEIFEDFYPDQAHFLFELLQNAEDAGATETSFVLQKDGCSFEHNGIRTFAKTDVQAITGIHNSAKRNTSDQIGRFGIGFKSVFVYTLTPTIYSGEFSFRISRLVMPELIPADPSIGLNTRFWLPFDNPKKAPADAHAEVKSGLSELAETTLLFLSGLQSIRWQVEGVSGELRRVQHAGNHFEAIKEINGKTKTSAHFLKFEQPVKGLEKQRVAVAFELRCLPQVQRFDPKKALAKQFKIVPAKPGRVAVYFPAEKETSGLRFHLHAPFVPELSRASIKETPANDPLFEQLARLTAAALHQIRDLGLLTGEFLAVLPNPHDPLSARYECIRSVVVEEMKTQPLTPTNSKSHAPAKNLLQAKAPLKNLLSEEDIEFLCDEKPLHWAMSRQKNSDIDRFLEGLEIDEWDIDEFVALLKDKATRSAWPAPDEDFMEWLSQKPAEWHQKLYALLYDELEAEDNFTRLANRQIVRLNDGSYSVGDACYFPSDGVEHDETHPRVDAAVFTSGRKRKEQEKARKFLEGIGVGEVGEAEQVQVILDQRYSKEAEIPDRKTYLKDLRRFIKLVKDDPQTAGLFGDYWILESKDQWCQPSQVFLDRPFMDTGLRAYHDALPEDHEARRWALANHYQKCGIAIKLLVQFAREVGVQDGLPIEKQSTWRHPNRKELRDGLHRARQTPTGVDEDWTIPGIKEALSNPSKQLAKLLWRMLMHCERRHLKARFCPNQQYKPREKPSSLVLLLRECAWVPQGRSDFVRPADASWKRRPKDFEIDLEWTWLEAIGFGENDAKKSEKRREMQAVAKKLGFNSIEVLRRAQRFAAFPSEEQQRILTDVERKRSNEQERADDDQPDTSDARTRTRSGARKGRRTTGSPIHDGRSSASTRGTRKRTSASNRRQFISYVAVQPDAEEPDPDGLNHEARMTLEEKAIQLILSSEAKLRRTPTNNPGFDLFEANKRGKPIRWIEVKAMTGCLEDRPVGLSRTQFDCARKHGEAFWLYIVEYAGDEKNARIVRIQDPAGKAQTFTFDHGWMNVAELDGIPD